MVPSSGGQLRTIDSIYAAGSTHVKFIGAELEITPVCKNAEN